MAPNKQLWKFGNDIVINAQYDCIRDMQNPKSNLVYDRKGYANTYGGQYWDKSNANKYANSTVLSHWFYLLSQGGNGKNDLGNSYNVVGIGISKAEKIAYETLKRLYPTADFHAAKDASIQAAIDLYQHCSAEVKSVIDAWHAVGISSGIEDIVYSSSAYIIGNNVSIKNIVVKAGNKLTIDACNEVTIDSDFVLEENAEFEILINP